MSIHVISLKNEIERRVHISSQFSKQGISFKFFDAIEPSQIEDIQKELGIFISINDLTKGEMGCFLSHLFLWKKLLESNDKYLTIFEDDIHLSDKSHLFLRDYNWINIDINLIKLEAFSDTVMIKLFTKVKLKNHHNIKLLKSRHLGTAGYIISREGAKQLISYIKSLDKIVPIDNIMFDKFIKNNCVYQMFPALCIQDFVYNKDNTNFNSCLEKERIVRQESEKIVSKENKSLIYKMKREILRLVIQIYNLHFKIWNRKIKFN